jgi:hypothetical protein
MALDEIKSGCTIQAVWDAFALAPWAVRELEVIGRIRAAGEKNPLRGVVLSDRADVVLS